MAKLKAERAHHDGAKPTKDEKPLTTKQRVLGVIAMVVLGGAWLFFFGYGMDAVFPVLSGIVMFVNVHIGRQVARTVSGTVVHLSRTGNQVISLHDMVRQENSDTLTFVTTRLSKKYQEGDAFDQVMTNGWLRIIYKD